jgi:hypothetical protein
MTSPWPLPIMFTSWGFRTKADRWQTPDELADYCAAAACPTVAVQLGDEPTTGEKNCQTSEAARLRERGLRVLVWGVSGADYLRQELERLGASDADWFPQVEGAPQCDLVLEQAAAGIDCPAIVTTYGGASTPAEVDALRSAGVRAAFIEIYSETHTDVDLLLWQGTMYGWRADELYACLGTYRGEMPDAYTDTAGIERNFALYLAEPMSSEQYYAWGAWTAEPKPPEPEPEPPTPEEEMEPVTDQQGRDAIAFAYRAAAQNWTDDKPRGRLTIAARIAQAANDDTKWNKCRDDVKAALDEAGVPEVWET